MRAETGSLCEKDGIGRGGGERAGWMVEWVTDVYVSIDNFPVVGFGDEDAVYGGCCAGHGRFLCFKGITLYLMG
jgi:hypothetical protein